MGSPYLPRNRRCRRNPPMPLYSTVPYILMNGSIPYSSICSLPFKPSIFSTPSSTGSPCIPSGFTRHIFLHCLKSRDHILIVRVSTRPICGLPLAVGGENHRTCKSLALLALLHTFLEDVIVFQNSLTCFSLSTKFRFVSVCYTFFLQNKTFKAPVL